MQLKVKLDEGAYPISYANDEAAGIDIRTPKTICVWPNSWVSVDTGVHVEIPKGYCGLLVSKSGLNINHGIQTTGLIDSDYRGSIRVGLYNFSSENYTFAQGDKITQMVIMPYAKCDINVTDSLSDTERGNNGFGSTGK